jgi:hypothetical protein
MKTLFGIAIAALLLGPGPAVAQAPKKAVAPAAVQTEFDGFIARFRAALKANDPAAVTSMTQLPFQATYPDAVAFRTKGYPAIFKAKARACIQRAKPAYDRDGEGRDNYFVFCGEDIFVFTKTPSGFLFTEVGGND